MRTFLIVWGGQFVSQIGALIGVGQGAASPCSSWSPAPP